MKRKCSLSPPLLISLLMLGATHSWPCGNNSTTVTLLPTLGGSFLQVSALNGAGQMTGFALLPDFSGHAFLIGSGGISDLGTLGGTFSQGYAINASGQVAGEANISGDSQIHAFLYTGGTMVDLGTLGGSVSSAVAINDAGQVAGTSQTSGDLASVAFLYSAGSMVSLGTLGGNFSSATAINAAGSVAGSASTELDSETHAFLYTGGTMLDLGTLGGGYAVALDLNDAEVVVGASTLASGLFHAFVHSGGAMQDLGTLGGTFSYASAVNNGGQVLGVSTTADAATRGFIHHAGTMTDLGTLGGDYTFPSALNNLGQIVGGSAISDGSLHAFLWTNGTMVDLNSLLPPDSGWILTSGLFINDTGRIVGRGTYNGIDQWFALDPASQNGPPVADAGPDQNAICRTEVTLDGSGSSDPDGDALTYQWSYGGNVFSTNATALALFDTGTYSITLTVTDPCGQSSQDEVIVQVTDPIAPTLTVPPVVTISTDANCQGEVPNIVPSVVAADNCTPASALVITQNPPVGTLLGGGVHAITVSVTDASGNTTSESVTLNIVDTIAPVIVSSPSALTVATGENCQGIVPNVASHVVATDNCTPAAGLAVTQTPEAGTLLERGQHIVTVTVTDAAGNSTTSTVTLTIADTTAPVIASITANPPVIWSPNNQLVPVTVTVLASDNCDGSPVNQIISVTANQPVPAADIQITGNLTVKLAASKGSSGSERIYTITVRSGDASGNYSTGTVTVTVPKNQSDDGNTVSAAKSR